MCFAFYMLEAWSSMMILNMISKAFKKGDQFRQYSIYNLRTWEEKPGNWGLHGQSHLSSKAQASRVTWNPIFNKMSDKVMKSLKASPLERISTELMGPSQGFNTDPSLSSVSQSTLVIPSCGSYSSVLPVAKVWLSQGLKPKLALHCWDSQSNVFIMTGQILHYLPPPQLRSLVITLK